MSISPARTAAFDVLLKIERDRSFSSVLLPQFEARLNEPDRGLCHEIVLGVLRRKLFLDRFIDARAKGRKLDIEVRTALRIGLFQLLYLDRVPAYSAINESVELTRRAKKTSAAGFVNALLRGFQRQMPAPAFADEIDRISAETSHPRWLVEKWESEFGIERARSIADANNETPRLSFRLTGKFTGEPAPQWERSEAADGAFLTDGLGSGLKRLADDGEIYFQDEGSQIVSLCVAELAAGRVLDVCAAPGGKTTLIAERMKKPGMIVAGDLTRSRVELLADNCRRLGHGSISVLQYNAELPLPFAEGTFDTILVDAPCSGTGTIRHNPELRYLISSEDFAEFYRKQLQILENASKLTALNGTLVYSTCSLEVEENERVCEAFLKLHPEFNHVRPGVPERFLTDGGFARTFPDRDKMDGFVIAAFRRAA
jgi:16S rRNA (cytosine967-C5)-methyltransferase